MKRKFATLALAAVLSLAVCAQPALAEESAVSVSDVAGTYTYEESVQAMMEFTVDWTLELSEDGTYALTEDNPNTGVTVYSGEYTVEDAYEGYMVTAGEYTSDTGRTPEAGFFNADGSSVWNVFEDGTMNPQEAESPADASEADDAAIISDVIPDELVGTSFVYTEETEYGFTVVWTLSFDDEENATLVESNSAFGDTTYTVTWQFTDGNIITRITESDSGEMPIADFFDSENNYLAKWVLTTADSSMLPYSVAAAGSAESTGDADGSGIMMDDASGSSESNADYSNVAYADDSDSQALDIYLPEGDGPFPVIVVVHGGGFMFGDQAMDIIQPVISAGLENGYAVVSVDYRKSSEAQFPAALADVKAAVRYVRANADEYSFDSDSIVIWGESAGAYLSVMTALTANVESLNGDVDENLDYSSEVAALVDFYGPIEFYVMDDEYADLGIESSFGSDSSFESQFLGQNLMDDEEYTYTTYWGTYVDEFTNTELIAWIQAGDSDTSVPYTESENLAERLTELLGDEQVSFGIIEGAEHEDDLFYTDENLAAVFEFLATVIG